MHIESKGTFSFLTRVILLACLFSFREAGAQVWGVIVMAVTGIILWFPEFFAPFLPWWGYEAAEIIHYFEALLATLAIVVWHLFFVIFHPGTYPINLTLLHGRVSGGRLREHHPKEYAEARDDPGSEGEA